MDEEIYKEVWFGLYCQNCIHFDEDESSVDCPCYDCLAESTNLYSHKPIHFKGKPGFEDFKA